MPSGSLRDSASEEFTPADLASMYKVESHRTPDDAVSPVSKKQRLSEKGTCSNYLPIMDGGVHGKMQWPSESEKPCTDKMSVSEGGQKEESQTRARHPSRNMFAAGKTKMKKERFSLNAEKVQTSNTEVKSRLVWDNFVLD